MKTLRQSDHFKAFAAYAAIIWVWLPFAILLWTSGGSPERALQAIFGRYSRYDAFEFIDGIAGPFCIVHSILSVVATLAVACRRFDVFTIVWIGPLLALLCYVVADGISDPAWFTIVGMCSIGEIVSAVVSLGYWAIKRRGTRTGPTSQGTEFVSS